MPVSRGFASMRNLPPGEKVARYSKPSLFGSVRQGKKSLRFTTVRFTTVSVYCICTPVSYKACETNVAMKKKMWMMVIR
jgi:hypothetical protein